MKNSMEYNGFYGSVEFSGEDNVFFGRLIGINDRVLFEGDSVTGLRSSFEEAVDDYIEICEKMGKEPERAYKGSFNVRIAPTLHRELSIYSETHGMSLNSTVEEAIRSYIK